MQVESEPAVILHRRDYRDSSLLLDIYTRDHGRVGLIARGAKRPKGRWRGLLEPLRLLQLGWSGRGELKTLTQADPIEPGIRLTGLSLYAGFYMAELLLRLTAREDAQSELFSGLVENLKQLETEPEPSPALRQFECRLLDACGYALPLEATEDGEAIEPRRCYSFDPRTGFTPTADGAAGSYIGGALLALRDEAFSHGEHRGAMRRLLAQALQPHLGSRPLQSAATLRAMQRLRKSNTDSGA